MYKAASHHASNPTFGRTRGEAGAIITPVQVVEHLADDEVDGNERALPARALGKHRLPPILFAMRPVAACHLPAVGVRAARTRQATAREVLAP